MAPLRVLLIEDSDDDAALLRRALARAGYEVATHQVDTAEQLNEALDNETFDIAIADHRMPLFSGTSALDMIRKRGIDLPFMFVSGTIGEEVAIQAMKEGACDYIVKGDLSRLPAVIEREMREAAVRRERRMADERVKYLAFHDVLTGLPNRAFFDDAFEQSVLTSVRDNAPLALMVLDLDGFKNVNDTLGHDAGDEVLRQVAGRVRATLRPSDLVARLGGDEFAVVLCATTSDGAEDAAHKIVQALAQPFVIGERALEVNASIGIAMLTSGATPDALRQRADAAMYYAKRDRIGYAVFEPQRVHAYNQRTASLMRNIASG